jgi:hypothetical protein
MSYGPWNTFLVSSPGEILDIHGKLTNIHLGDDYHRTLS